MPPNGKPRIRIINENGLGHHTQVLTEDGTDISNAIQEIDLHMKVGEVNTAKIKAILVGGAIDAVVTELQARVLPPPLPKTQYRLTIEPPRFVADEVGAGKHKESHFRLERLTPLPTYGVSEEVIGEGWLDPIGPLELVCDAPE